MEEDLVVGTQGSNRLVETMHKQEELVLSLTSVSVDHHPNCIGFDSFDCLPFKSAMDFLKEVTNFSVGDGVRVLNGTVQAEDVWHIGGAHGGDTLEVRPDLRDHVVFHEVEQVEQFLEVNLM